MSTPFGDLFSWACRPELKMSVKRRQKGCAGHVAILYRY